MPAGKLTTKISTKGQVILPKVVREARHWPPGTELQVEMTKDGGVLLSPLPLFPPTRHQDVAGMLKYDGPPKTIEDINASISQMYGRRRDGG